jgi:hypothetical protein
MKKLVFYSLLVFIAGTALVSCQEAEYTNYSDIQKEEQALIDSQKVVFDEYVKMTVGTVYSTVSQDFIDSSKIGFVFIPDNEGTGDPILPGDVVGIRYSYEEIRRGHDNKLYLFSPIVHTVTTTTSISDTIAINNNSSIDPALVTAITQVADGYGLSCAVEKLRKGGSATVIMSYKSYGNTLSVSSYRPVVCKIEVTYLKK